MKITQKTTPNQSVREKKYPPDMIVCHITDGAYAGAVAWHCNPTSEVSSHYIVSRNGDVTQIVPLERMAWCNGTTTNGDYRDSKYSTNSIVRNRRINANNYTVSIECEGYYAQTKGALTDIQLKTLAELIQHIQSEIKRIYGTDIPIDRQHIIGHCDINPKTRPCCPGELFPWDKLIAMLKSGTAQATGKLYRVQVGAYSNKANAVAMADELKRKGYPAIIKED